MIDLLQQRVWSPRPQPPLLPQPLPSSMPWCRSTGGHVHLSPGNPLYFRGKSHENPVRRKRLAKGVSMLRLLQRQVILSPGSNDFSPSEWDEFDAALTTPCWVGGVFPGFAKPLWNVQMLDVGCLPICWIVGVFQTEVTHEFDKFKTLQQIYKITKKEESFHVVPPFLCFLNVWFNDSVYMNGTYMILFLYASSCFIWCLSEKVTFCRWGFCWGHGSGHGQLPGQAGSYV